MGNLTCNPVTLTKDQQRPCGAAFCSLLLLVLFVFGTTAIAGSNLTGTEWFEVAPLPGPRAFHMTASALTDSGPRMYAIGGQRSPSDTMERLCIEYSPQSNTWRQRAAMSQRRGLGQACVVKGKIWAFGGCRTFGTGLSAVEVYDPATDKWTVGPSMPQDLYDFGAAAWRDSLIFTVGGGSWHPSMPPTGTVRLYDPTLEIWYSATSLPEPLGAMACGIVGDTLLVATGWTDSGPTNRAWRGLLNPANPRVIIWSELDTLPGPRRCRAACGVANRELYVIGGLSLLDSGSNAGTLPERRELRSRAPNSPPIPRSLDSLIPSSFSALSEVWSLAARNQWTARTSKPHAVSCVFGSASGPSSRIYVPGGYPGTAPYLQVTEYLDMSGYSHDVGVTGIASPVGRLVPETTCPVSVTVRNFGTAAEDLSAHITILDSITQLPVFTGDSAFSLAPDSSRLVEFGSFVPPGQAVFHTTASVSLAGDQNPNNDTARARSRTTVGSDPDGFGYVYKTTQEPDNMTFSWFDPSGGAAIDDWSPNGDEGTSRRNLPFQFDFYGSPVARVYVCTNGYLQTSDNIASLNFPLPYEGITNVIAPFWDDISVRNSGQVYENFTTERAVYTWVDARRNPPDTGRLTFQVIIQLNGDIRFNYLDVTADATSSTIGIQGRDGSWSWYQEYVYNADPLKHVPTSSTSILFDAPPVGIREQQSSGIPPVELHAPSVCRGPVRMTVGTKARSLRVFDVSGRLVRTLIPNSSLQTASSVTWDRRDQQDRYLPAGAYLLRAASPQGSLTRKLILLD